jgi:ATP-dependent helicase YprA (DUF1998 family)
VALSVTAWRLDGVFVQSIPTLLAGRDLLSIAPTGSGKTGAFVIPLLSRLLSRPPASRPDLFVTTLPEGTLGIHFDEMWPVVSEVEDDGLAARREPRIRAGCRLLSINGRAMDRLAFQDAVPLIQQRPVQLLWQDEAAAGENTGAAATSSATQPSPRAVILAPTRELATQIARETKLLAAGTALVTALLEHQDTLDPSILGECDVLVSTPMRLAALIRSASCRLEAVEVLVVRCVCLCPRPVSPLLRASFGATRIHAIHTMGGRNISKYLRTP